MPANVPAGASGAAAAPVAFAAPRLGSRPRLLERYREFLPVTDKTPLITLGEGNTPLVPIPHIGRRIGVPNLFVKFEGMNPTGSFKDRGMVMAISKAVEEGDKAIICASTGNTSASAAAYGAVAGLETIIVLPKGKIALGKMIQGIAAGAKVLAVDGNFDDAFRVVREMAEQKDHPVTLVNHVNPNRIEGQTTAAFEVCDDLGRAPEILALPVGNAGNITAYWLGFNRYQAAGRITAKPRMWGFQAAGSAPIVMGHPIEKPETIATAIRIGNPASWKRAEAARDESGGLIDMVTDDEILAAYAELARTQGIFCEPSSAASVAGVIKKAAAGLVPADATVVCVLTGHGLKDPERAEAVFAKPDSIIESAPTTAAVMKALGW